MAKIIMPFCESKERSDSFRTKYDLKLKITKAGQTYCLYDYIQAQREDTEIYPTLQKYGNLDIMSRPAEDVYQDCSEALELRDLYERENRLEEIYYGLPLDERNKFQNFYDFRENGLKFYMKKAQEEIKLKNKPPVKNKETGENNEQK